MRVADLNPEFAGIGQPSSPIEMDLEARMPIGQHAGRLIKNLIQNETDYMRWFLDNVSKYSLTNEAHRALVAQESENDSLIPHKESVLDFYDDIPW